MPSLASSRHQVIEGLEIDNDILKIIQFCKEAKSLQAIMQYMDWKDRTKFSRRLILPLLEKGIIERTIPEKPSSSKQRYQITNHGFEILQNLKGKT
ncbi:TPA: Fic family protein [Legionella pneumophila]